MVDVIRRFSKDVPSWRPRVAPVAAGAETTAQRAALDASAPLGAPGSYLRVLAHDPEALAARTPFYHAVMHDAGGLDYGARELAAIGSSFVNGCVYCAATHAKRHKTVTGSDAVVNDVFRKGADAALGARDRAVFDFARHLSDAPPRADLEDIENLRQAGLDDLELLDLVLCISMFAWANRLMHGLGDPVPRGAE